MSIKGVIFDLDGTLADTLPDLTDAVNVGLNSLGYPQRSAADVRQWVGEGLPILGRKALQGGRSEQPASHLPEDATRGLGPDERIVEQMCQIVTAHYRLHRLDKTLPYPGIPELLDALSDRHIALAVLSNKPDEHTRPMVEALLGRWPWVAIEGYRAEEYRKPDPRTAQRIVAAIGCKPGEVMMVGDSAIDVLTGRNAGLVTVGVTWGFRDRPELEAADADYIIDHPRELLALISRLS